VTSAYQCIVPGKTSSKPGSDGIGTEAGTGLGPERANREPWITSHVGWPENRVPHSWSSSLWKNACHPWWWKYPIEMYETMSPQTAKNHTIWDGHLSSTTLDQPWLADLAAVVQQIKIYPQERTRNIQKWVVSKNIPNWRYHFRLRFVAPRMKIASSNWLVFIRIFSMKQQ